jgi:hypothetical protein
MVNLFGCIGSITFSSVMLLSVLLKLRDRKVVEGWISASLGPSYSRILFCALIAMEVLLVFIALWFGPGNGLYLVAVSGVMTVLAYLARFLRKGGEGCPCFGVVSLVAGVRSDSIFLGVFAITLATVTASNWLDLNVVVYCALSAALVVMVFFFAQKIYSSTFTGSVLDAATHADTGLLASWAGEGNPLVVIFLSTRCSVCMSFLKYLEAYSERFGSWVNMRLVIEGIDVDEETSFGGAIIVPGPHRELATAFRISESPSMVIWTGGKLLKYRGIHACNLGLSEFVRTASSRP